MLAVATSAPETKMRVGLVTSKKVGNAVARNRVRRRLREIIRRHQHEVINGIWMVVIASARAAAATCSMLEDEWLRLAKRASILAP
jgi:ribonuclease P protein component